MLAQKTFVWKRIVPKTFAVLQCYKCNQSS
jgi:hypothetical protein